MPSGGDALGLSGGALIFALSVSFVLGALMMLGIGFFAPCLILLSLLGMNPLAAFPIMMGANIFPLLIGGASFVKTGRYSFRTRTGIDVGRHSRRADRSLRGQVAAGSLAALAGGVRRDVCRGRDAVIGGDAR